MTRLAARLRLVATAVLFSTGGAAIKAVSLSSWQVASFRAAIAAIALLLLVPAARRRWTLRMLPVAVAFAMTMGLFVTATKLTTAANAIFLQSTSPVWVLLAGPLLLRERVTRHDVAFMLLIAAGMLLFFVGVEAPQATAPDPARGNVLAVVSGVFYAGVVVGLRWLGRGGTTDDGVATLVAGNVLLCLATLPLALPVSHVALADVTALLYLGVVQIGLAYLLMTTAMPQVPALEASTILLVEPALNPLWAWLAQGERPSSPALVGGALIVASAALKSWWDMRVAPPRRSA